MFDYAGFGNIMYGEKVYTLILHKLLRPAVIKLCPFISLELSLNISDMAFMTEEDVFSRVVLLKDTCSTRRSQKTDN